MLLLYLALAYAAGVAIGWWAWELGWLACRPDTGRWADMWHWLWLLPLGLLPAAIWLHRRERKLRQARARAITAITMRWPAWAGFEPPGPYMGRGVWLALALCLSLGILRYAAQPLRPCLDARDLAYWARPASQAFDRRAPSFTLEGTIASYPLVDDGRLRLDIAAQRFFHPEQPDRAIPVQGTTRVSTSLQRAGEPDPAVLAYMYGQPVRVTGRLVQPGQFTRPDTGDEFDYARYLATQNIQTVIYDARVEIISGAGTDTAGTAWRRALYAVRRRSEQLINRTLPEPYAALTNGMVLGIEAGIPDSVYAQFNRTGTSHVIVISGANVAVVMALVLGAARHALRGRRWQRPAGALLAVGAIGVYAVLVGGDPAVMRAAIMGSLGALALGLRRPRAAIISLAAAAWLMALNNPAMLWSVSYQLSVAATAGVILFASPLSAGLVRLLPTLHPGPLLAALTATSPAADRPGRALVYARGLLQDSLIVTLAANLAVTPLLLFHFGRLSLTTLPANLAIAPVQPYILLGGMGAIIAGLLGATALAGYLLWVPWLGLVWTWTVVQWFAQWETGWETGWGTGATWSGFGLAHLAAAYTLLIALTARRSIVPIVRWWRSQTEPGAPQTDSHEGEQAHGWFWWRRWLALTAWQRWFAPTSAPVLSILCVSTILVWRVGFTQPDGYLHVYFLDVGQGDGIFIQTPSGRQILIDGGSSPQQLLTQLGDTVPFWDRSLDLLVLTHPDSDHMDAQTTLPARYRLGRAVETRAGQANPEGAAWRATLAAAHVPVTTLAAGSWLDLGDGVALWVLWPRPGQLSTGNGTADDNENSLVLKLVFGQFSALLMGDVGHATETRLLAHGEAAAQLPATVLKVGHHGSGSSTAHEFVAAVQPRLAVIQVGENAYGHPHPQVLENLAGSAILRNDHHGRVHIRSDGARMWISTTRHDPQSASALASYPVQ